MFARPKPIPPEPGQESVWDYPRPPRLEDVPQRLKVVLNGEVIAETDRGKRVLETSHPPVYYLPPEDVKSGILTPVGQKTFCEWKGYCTYYTVTLGETAIEQAAWSYTEPVPEFEGIAGYIGFYASCMDACYVGDEQVEPQPGNFYGGWVTKNVVGPFKGIPGSWGW